MRINPLALGVLLLFLLSAVAATVLLLVSGWFIAASALAGVSTAVLAFNYVIPSTAIRLLTFVRILSGYGANYFGHNQLLQRLTQIRSRFYDAVMRSAKTAPVSEQIDILERHIEATANRHLAATLPTVTGVILAVGLGLLMWLELRQSFWLYALTLGIAVAVFFFLGARMRSAVIGLNQITARYRSDLLQRLKSASLWQLSASYGPESPVQPLWQVHRQRLKDLEFHIDWSLQALAYGALVISLWLLPEGLVGYATVIVLPLVLLSLPEWLGPVFRAQRPVAEALCGQREIQPLFKHAEPESGRVPPLIDIEALHLEGFCWLRQNVMGEALSATFKKGELIGIQGDSGGGKTSLLMALAGLLQSRGSVSLFANNQHVHQMDICHSSIHYCEQAPCVLSDTLRNNLLIARPDASDEQLYQALTFACLENSVNALDEWLGEQGRALSGGERKRLGLARAWLTQRTVWLLDEPFEGLDAELTARLCGNIKAILSNHMVLLVSHRPIIHLTYDQVVFLSGIRTINSK